MSEEKYYCGAPKIAPSCNKYDPEKGCLKPSCNYAVPESDLDLPGGWQDSDGVWHYSLKETKKRLMT